MKITTIMTAVGTRTSSLDHQKRCHSTRGAGVDPLPPELHCVWHATCSKGPLHACAYCTCHREHVTLDHSLCSMSH